MSATKSGHSSGPQLRESCDSCNLAKVKCTKTRPRCKRCSGRNECCIYSISLRSVSRKHQHIAGSNADSFDVTKKSIVDGQIVDALPFPLPGQNIITPPTSDADDVDIYDPMVTRSWARPSFQPMQIDGSRATMPHVSGSVGSSGKSTPSHETDIGFPMPMPLTNTNQTPGIALPTTMDCSSPAFPSISPALSQPVSTTCGCHQILFSSLTELSYTQALPLAFDEALSTNKSILSICSGIIDCCVRGSHLKDTQLLLSLASLLVHAIHTVQVLSQSRKEHKILAAPSQSLSYPGAPPQTRPFWALQTQSDIDRDLCCPTTGARRKSVRLTLGSYQLDRADEEILQESLIRIELGKIERTLDALQRCFEARDGDLARGLVGYLRRQLQENQQNL